MTKIGSDAFGSQETDFDAFRMTVGWAPQQHINKEVSFRTRFIRVKNLLLKSVRKQTADPSTAAPRSG